MQKKVPQKRNILMVITLVLFGLVFVMGAALAASIGDFLHYEDSGKVWKGAIINAGQSNYTEDENLPHFVQFTDLAALTPYYFYIYMDYYKSSSTSCGFDKLYQYDDTTRLSPIQDTGLPTDNYFLTLNNGPLFSDLPNFGGDGYLKYGGDTLTNISLTEAAFTGTGDLQANILVKFTTTTGGTVVFYWGQHLGVGHIGTTDNCEDPSTGSGSWDGGGLRTKIWNEDGDNNHPTLCGDTPYEDCWFSLPTGNAINIMAGAIRPRTFDGFKWFDDSGDGVYQVSSPKLRGRWIYLQECDSADPATCSDMDPTVTDVTEGVDGYYSIYVPLVDGGVDGYYRVCEDLNAQDPKWQATHPTTLDNVPLTRNVCHDVYYLDDIYLDIFALNFGNYYGDTSVSMGPIIANPAPDGRSVLIEWYTVSESDFSHFNVYRSRSLDGRLKLLGSVNPGLPEPIKYYEFTDQKARPNKTYYYWVEAVDNDGETEMFGPASATIPRVRSVRPPKSR